MKKQQIPLHLLFFVLMSSGFLLFSSCSPSAQQTDEQKKNGEKTKKETSEQKQDSDNDTARDAAEETASGKNRLANATSPYLRIHADNPVHWYPWGEEAFNQAKQKDKPIFLSIGYYTCHWCHVMERKVFMNDEIAEQLNNTFVNIKVDREQRPAVDHTYMTAAHRMGRRGGWPLSVFMTPDKKPFFIGTYIPPKRIKPMIKKMNQLWSNQREKLLQNANKISKALSQTSGGAGDEVGKEALHSAFSGLSSQFDEEHAGFGSGTKFPSPHNMLFLLRYWKRTEKEKALTMATRTLDAMRRGGMYDHIGYGFHRYSTDPEWKLPHFEKMLYDQAMLTYTYAEAYQATEKERYKRTVQETVQFVERDMGADNGGFFSALASGTDAAEGGEYIYSTDEVRDVLSDSLASLVIDVYNMTEEGNYREEASGEKTGKNIPRRTASIPALAKEHDMTPKTLRTKLETARKKLYEYRETRPQVGVDDKILADWNGMMIAALAKAGRVLGEKKYTRRAEHAAEFILSTLQTENGRLKHRYREGDVGITGKATDYAYFTWGLLELYQTTFKTKYLEQAIALTDTFLKYYWDKENGGFYFSPSFADTPMGRQKQVRDGARPSANSVAMWNLFRIGRITANSKYQEKARQVGAAFSSRVSRRPSSMTMMMTAVDSMVGPSFEVVISGDPESDDTRKMLRALWDKYVPRKVVVQRPAGESPEIAKLASYTKNQLPKNGRATAYVCQNYACKLPTTSISKMNDLLDGRATFPEQQKGEDKSNE